MLCGEVGIHTHDRLATQVRGMYKILYRLVDDRDDSLVIETEDRVRFVRALEEQRASTNDTPGWTFPSHYTITVTEMASGEDVASMAWNIVR